MTSDEQLDTPFNGDEAASESAGQLQAPLILHVADIDKERFPDLNTIRSVTLKDGPRARKVATYTTITNRHTGERHHDALTIKTFRKRQEDWEEDQQHTVSLTSEGEDEIHKLMEFLQVTRSGTISEKGTEFIVVPVPEQKVDGPALQRLLNEVSAPDKADVVAKILEVVSHDTTLFQVLLERATRTPELFADAAAALNLATYTHAVEQLKGLIHEDRHVQEAELQALLTEHPWMFGSEYSELLDRRRWTRDEQQDFILRRTTDNYIELIEIKTPLEGMELFRYDPSHSSYYPGAELSKVLGQVQSYIEKLDADRYSILARDGEDTCKIRAKIIIGRDGNERQRQSLRRLNGHLHRIEVLTFDQLLRIAESVLSYLQDVLRPLSQ